MFFSICMYLVSLISFTFFGFDFNRFDSELIWFDVVACRKAKLYRFDKEGNQWKERGVGTIKLLKHKETGKVRVVFRQSKTLKICANHLVLPTISIQEHAGNEKSCVWHATDFSDGELKEELFCIRFASIESEYFFLLFTLLILLLLLCRYSCLLPLGLVALFDCSCY
ncbi:hypothetical protein MKW94_027866 [Papaver nudicaule]|uniref:RanBD1 domain-containing protein n=1 Tax=Papaver nudicaule TaxID=74823 RepID=A0AA41RYV8_PAPNU|nr:hypothetical protein [Papaver nudicaule]